jgi:SAM-dependent methyltransferase
MPDPIAFDAVADIYDEYVRVEFDIPFWLSEARAVNAKVLELTCGTGRVSLPLLRAGVDLTCVDYAPEMLARFRTKLEAHHLSCTLVRQDIAELDLPDRFALIFIPFHSFSEILREERRRDALARIREHLAPRGVFICALQNPVVRTASMDGEMRTVGEFPLAN